MTGIARRTLTAMTAAGLLAAAASVASAGGVRVVTADSGRVWTDARHGYYVAAPVVVVREPLRLRFVESYNGVGPPVSTVPWGPDYEIYRDKISGGMQ